MAAGYEIRVELPRNYGILLIDGCKLENVTENIIENITACVT